MGGMRQRSPPTTPAYYEDSNMTWQAMRAHNADGTSTVYRVHDSMMYGPGGTMPRNGIPCRGDDRVINHGNMQYDCAVPESSSSFMPYHPHTARANVVYLERNDHENDEGDDESDGEDPSSPTISAPKPQRAPRCSSTSPFCITTGIVLALSFIVGYCFLIEAMVTRRKNHHVQRWTGSGLRSAPVAHPPPQYQYPVQQGALEAVVPQPQYYVLQPVPPPLQTQTTRSTNEQQPSDVQQLRSALPSDISPSTWSHHDPNSEGGLDEQI
ncbi:hypothetical protein ACHAWF_015818 [Thalassiosira exigua]